MPEMQHLNNKPLSATSLVLAHHRSHCVSAEDRSVALRLVFRVICLVLAGVAAASAGVPVMGHDEGEHSAASSAPMQYAMHERAGAYTPPQPDDQGRYWWKGNLHTHTHWSDGDQYPEVIADWYKKHGYHFLALSDHNILSRGEKWINASKSRGGMKAYEIYRERFGGAWIETRGTTDEELEVRLKPLAEFRTLFDEPGRFLMVESEEITDHRSVHMNATNLAQYIEPQRGESVRETIERNLAAVHAQRERTGQPMIAHLNHPNWSGHITAEEMYEIEDLKFFEVYNGHRGVRNYGQGTIKPLDRVWDIMLTKRLGELNLGVLYAMATDDAHHYENSDRHTARPGRGWVVVRSRFLTPEHLIQAIEAGDFYASTGVTLASLERTSSGISLQIQAEKDVQYTVEFIGTRKGYDASSEPIRDEQGNIVRATHRYSDDVGQVLKTVKGNVASYTAKGDELYIRAKITSTKLKENPFQKGEFEMAWVQPIVVKAGE